MQYRTASWLTIVPLFAAVVALAVFNIVADPYRVLHDPLWDEMPYAEASRYGNAGLIRQYLRLGTGYDAVAIGTSLSDNFLPEQISATFGWGKTLNLAMDESRPHEQELLLRKALATGQVRHVLWELNVTYLTSTPTETLKRRDFPAYLYEGTTLDAWRYVLNASVFQDALYQMSDGWLFPGRFGKWHPELETLHCWYESPKQAARFGTVGKRGDREDILGKLERARQRRADDPNPQPYAAFPCLDEIVLPMVLEHPDVEFRIFFPPLSMLLYAYQRPHVMLGLVDMRGHLARKLDGVQNARVYAFETDIPGVGDIRRYMDESHYDRGIGDEALERMGRDQSRLTPDNFAAYKRAFLDNVSAYTLD